MAKIVILDPGHGGTDPGCVLKTRYEKDDVLVFAKVLKQCFEKKGVTVYLTRERDETVLLNTRCALERKLNSAAFISCHRDSGSPSAKGATVWLHNKAPKSYQDWAADVIAGIEKIGFSSNRSQKVNLGFPGNKEANYQVNRETNGPSMLLEMGFLTNEINNQELDKNLTAYAQAVCDATCRFIKV